jgi:hypothetical protein
MERATSPPLSQIRKRELEHLHQHNREHPKNEAWLPIMVAGAVILVEPQQSSNTTFSLADFYTPFEWHDGALRFRKGGAGTGIARTALTRHLDAVDFQVRSPKELRRLPARIRTTRPARGCRLYRLLDEPATYPHFTIYRLEFRGSARSPASWMGGLPEGAFQQVIVTRGATALKDAKGRALLLSPGCPALIPATYEGVYSLSTKGAADVLLVSVPVPEGYRRGPPQW